MLGARTSLRQQDGVAALEFALVAPLMAVMIMGVFDSARALVAWQQTENAAQAVAQAAEKLSVVSSNTSPALTYTQMQNAMSTIYAEMPGLSQGSGTGIFNGNYSVTLSEIIYYYAGLNGAATLCHVSNIYACGTPQYPYVSWSTYLTEGGTKLLTSTSYLRACGKLQRTYPTWGNTGITPPPSRWQQMVDPSNQGAIGFVMTPQVVADVQYVFTPIFAQILPTKPTITFVASAMLSTPVGDNALAIAYTANANDGVINNCTPPTTVP